MQKRLYTPHLPKSRSPWEGLLSAFSTAPSCSGGPRSQWPEGGRAPASANARVSDKYPRANVANAGRVASIAAESQRPGHWTRLPVGNPPRHPGLMGPRHSVRTPRRRTKIIQHGALSSRFVSRSACCFLGVREYSIYFVCCFRCSQLENLTPPVASILRINYHRPNAILRALSRYPLRPATSALPSPRLSS